MKFLALSALVLMASGLAGAAALRVLRGMLGDGLGYAAMALPILFAVAYLMQLKGMMSEQRRLEDALKQVRADAEAGSALTFQFLADVSHALRTPLAGILGLAGLLKDNPHLGAEERGHAEGIALAGGALLTTANDILAFSELQTKRFDIRYRPASVGDIASETLRLFQPSAADKGLTLALAVADAMPASVLIDGARVRQMLLNLLANAVKFTDRGGVTVAVSYDAEGQMLKVSVADTGPGIDAHRLPLLFDRVLREGPEYPQRHGGVGLGLAMCKALAEAMGGTIVAANAPPQGAVLSFALPAPPAISVVAVQPGFGTSVH